LAIDLFIYLSYDSLFKLIFFKTKDGIGNLNGYGGRGGRLANGGR